MSALVVGSRRICLLWAGIAVLLAATSGQSTTCEERPLIPRLPGSTSKYVVGVMAIRGIESAFNDFNATFANYLTITAGRRFDPPLSFSMLPVEPGTALDTFTAGGIDFIFANPSVSSCIDTEVGTNSLVTMRNRRTVNGNVYTLEQFGGVIFTRADNNEIRSIRDIRGKSVAAVSITGLGSGQMQFQVLRENGIHHLQDPKQIVFMKNQVNVVNAVLRGQVDVGFVRTDQLERTKDKESGELVDLSLIKIIGPLQNITLSNGSTFPFTPSTPLYPEWNIASLPHVTDVVNREVQESLLRLENRVALASQLTEACKALECPDNQTEASCFQQCADNTLPCGTNDEVVVAASVAKTKGKFTGWRTTLSYMPVRNMQHAIDFLVEDAAGRFHCARAADVADAVVCPDGYFKREPEDIASSCEQLGHDCYGFQCLCSPCVRAYDVDFTQSPSEGVPCSKFSVCGTVEQTKSIQFRAVDNKKRLNAIVSVSVLDERGSHILPQILDAKGIDSPHHYFFQYDAVEQPTGVAIVEVFVEGEQISESPFRLEIVERDCNEDAADSLKVPDELGTCICPASTVSFGSNGCARTSVILPSVMVPILLLMGVAVNAYVQKKRRQAESIWRIEPDELIFAETPLILGRGTFGMVIEADFRGTPVAVKRVLPASSPGGSHLLVRKNSKRKLIRNPSKVDLSVEDDLFSDDEFMAESGSDMSGSFLESGHHSGDSFITSSTGDIKSFLNVERPKISRTKSFIERPSTLIDVLRTDETLAAQEYERMKKEFISEMSLLSKLRHPSITTVMGAVVATGSEPMMVMEKMEFGSLSDLLKNESMVLDGDIISPILTDISSGIRFLHSSSPPVVHGDLKGQNVLVDSRFRAKVTDFGLSHKANWTQSVHVAGTPFWLAPELLRQETSNTPASDIYAFGVVLHEIFTRKEPYQGEKALHVLKLVASKEVRKRPNTPGRCPPEIVKIMHACYEDDPSLRPKAASIDVMLKQIDPDTIDKYTTNTKKSKAARTEDLLYQLFPKKMADALRDGEKVPPEKHEMVTVYFSDIVGYTNISSEMDATKVTNFLDRLYYKFDQLCVKHGVFKLETVGDAYMAATNLAEKQEDHAAIMARFALDTVAAANDTLIDEEAPEKGPLVIRVGFHCGPLVAHVVGTRTPHFTVLGDTVNTASRMESHSMPGRVQCSEATALAIQNGPSSENLGFRVRMRGAIQIKGKGEMVTAFVVPQRQRMQQH